jgi:hypothetical protein
MLWKTSEYLNISLQNVERFSLVKQDEVELDFPLPRKSCVLFWVFLSVLQCINTVQSFLAKDILIALKMLAQWAISGIFSNT